MPKLSANALKARAKRVKLVLMDVDGVLTNGWLFHFVDPSGELVEFKGVHAQDSISLTWLAKHGIKTGIISGRVSKGMAERAKMLGMSYVYQHRLDKLNVFREVCAAEGLEAGQAVFIGDDLPDLPVLRAAGIGIAVANARPEVLKAASWVTKAEGGQGAVREVAEMLLRAQGGWEKVLSQFD